MAKNCKKQRAIDQEFFFVYVLISVNQKDILCPGK